VRPIEGENLPQVVARLMSAGIMPLERIAPELPAEVTGLVKQMLSRDIGRRPASLIEVSRTLSRFTHVKAPEFAAPSGVSVPVPTPRTMVSARPKARIVSNRDALPLGPTMLSSPPVNSSLLRAAAEPTKPSRGMYVVGGAALLLGAIAWFASDRRPSTVGQPSATELATLPTAPERVVPAAAPVAPTAAAPAATPVAPSAAVPVTPRAPPAGTGPKAPLAKLHQKPSAPAPAKADSDLFPGRK
jgi:hypothetical protein